MAEYRAYAVGKDGHFVSSRPLVGTSDVLAITWAKQFVDGHELNCGAASASLTGWSTIRRKNHPVQPPGYGSPP